MKQALHANERNIPPWIWAVVAGVCAVAVAVGCVFGVIAYLRHSRPIEPTVTVSVGSAVSSLPSLSTATTTTATTTTTTTTVRTTRQTVAPVKAPVIVVEKADGSDDPMAAKKRPEEDTAPATTAAGGKGTGTTAAPLPESGITPSFLRSSFGAKDALVGIDVYRGTGGNKGITDWNAVKNAGVQFVLIRCGYRTTVSGKIYEDANFNRYMQGALAAGLPVGVYFYSTAVNEQEAKEEAAFVLNVIKDYNVTWPVMLDCECFDDRMAGVGKKALTDNIIAFMEYVIQRGQADYGKTYTPMLFSYRYALRNRFDMSRLTEYRVCLSQFVNTLGQKDNSITHCMWQCASDGKVGGIQGDVDMNIAYEDFSKPHMPRIGQPEPEPTETTTTTAALKPPAESGDVSAIPLPPLPLNE